MMVTASSTGPIPSDFLSAAESIVVLCGVSVHDRHVIALVFKELVARGYLSLAEVTVERRLRSPKQLLVFVPGPLPGPSGNAVLDVILDLIKHAAPPSGKSAEEEDKDLDQAVQGAIRAVIDATANEGGRPSYRVFRDTLAYQTAQLFPVLKYQTFPGGLVGVSVDELTGAVLHKHPAGGWIGHAYVRKGVLPSLVARGYFADKGRGVARWTHRCFYEYRRRPTPAGLRERERLEDRLGIRLALRRVRGCTKALDGFLISIAGNPVGIEANFDAIEAGVADGWSDYHRD